MKTRLFGSGKMDVLRVMFCVSLCMILISGTFTLSHASTLSMEYASGKLSADVSKASLQSVLEALSAKCNIKVFRPVRLGYSQYFQQITDKSQRNYQLI